MTVSPLPVNPETLTLDIEPESFTLGELCDLAEVAGEDVLERMAQNKLTARILVGLVWIIRRRDDPSYTIEQARSEKISVLGG